VLPASFAGFYFERSVNLFGTMQKALNQAIDVFHLQYGLKRLLVCLMINYPSVAEWV
jgi:hypothetical protein